MREQPDMPRLLACMQMLSAHAVPDAVLLAKLEEMLIVRDNWACARMGILGPDEAANLLLAHLETLAEDHGGGLVDDGPEATRRMQAALFDP